MTDYLIKTDGTAAGLTLGSAIADTDALEVQQAFSAPATTLHQTFAAIKTWIKAWIVKGDVGLGNVDNTSDATKNAAAVTLTNKTLTAPVVNSPTGIVKADVGLGNVANSLQLVAANNLSDLTDGDAARGNLKLAFGSLVDRFYTFNDCVNMASAMSSDFWKPTSAGTGAQAINVTGSFVGVGFMTMGLGTTNAGLAALVDPSLSSIKFGSGRARFGARAAIHTLSNGTDTFTTRIGFIDSATAESTDGAFFRYTDGVNSGKWQAVTRSNNTETATDTGVTVVADAFKRFTVDMNAAGTSCVFAIDGSTVATNTTNIPTGAGRETGYGAMSLKSAGTTSTTGGYVDYMEIEYLFSSPR